MFSYFSLYGFTPKFHLDEQALRLAFLQMQREWHPDFYGNDPEKQQLAISKTSLNNEAHKALSAYTTRIAYILKEMGLSGEGEKNTLPPDFLMEMLDLHDLIEEAVQGDAMAMEQAQEQLSALETDLLTELEAETQHLDSLSQPWLKTQLEPLQAKWQKFRYLNRLRKNLEGDVDI
ncbi:MAG: hypothetical protein IT244_09440 [Bacteroidia bacterium]|nr:hypothetical protein [Bacteroidia bacterium]